MKLLTLNDENALTGKAVLLSTICVLFVVLSQAVNFVDAIIGYTLHLNFALNHPFTYKGLLFSLASLIVCSSGYLIIWKTIHKKAVRIIFLFVIAFFSFIYVIEIQLYTTKNNVFMALFSVLIYSEIAYEGYLSIYPSLIMMFSIDIPCFLYVFIRCLIIVRSDNKGK